MLNVIMTLLRSLLSAFRGRNNLVAENLVLRHQLMVVYRQFIGRILRKKTNDIEGLRLDRTAVNLEKLQ